METKPLAKALHTVTVLVRLGGHIMASNTNPELTAKGAVMEALCLLGYEPDCADKDGCIAKAIKQLEAAPLAPVAPVAPKPNKTADVLKRILAAHDSKNNGAVMGEAMLCRMFADMARDALQNEGAI